MELPRTVRRTLRWPWRVAAVVLGAALAALFVRHVWWPSKDALDRAHVRRLLEERRTIVAEVESLEDALERPARKKERERCIERIETDGVRLRRIAEGLARRPVAVAAMPARNESPDEVESALHGLLAGLGADVEPLPRALVREVRRVLAGWRRQGVPRVIHDRARRLLPSVRAAFAAEGVPEALVWMAWQESAFDPEVCSPAGARGLWQLMPATARHLKLRVDDAFDACVPEEGGRRCDCEGIDDRVDPLKSSHAGARYLRGLLDAFGQGGVLMALAGYHRGEDGLRRALRSLDLPDERRSDFHYLVRMNLLPLETREYVPRVLAALLVGTRPELFGVAAGP
jgi:hypothetical protein